MNKELLDEFLIKKYGKDYGVFATDKAYELLGLKEKEIINDWNGAARDTINNWYYRVAFINFLANNYRIDGLVRISRGNSHDANWETEVLIFNNGGAWSEELNLYRTKTGDLYVSKPEVIDKEIITDEIIENWSKEYDLSYNGEDGRFVYCSYNDGSNRFCFSFETCYLVATAASKEYSKKVHGYSGGNIYLKRK